MPTKCIYNCNSNIKLFIALFSKHL